MAEYIKKEDARIVLLRTGIVDPFKRQMAFDELDSIPAINVTEQKHGKWIDPPKNPHYPTIAFFACSECGFIEDYRPKFCPNCGADMREESCTKN